MRRNFVGGFGLVQALVVVSLIGIIASIAVPATRDATISQRGKSSTENLRVIETAKRLFAINNPGVNLTSESQLTEYLPGGQLPPPAHTGETYSIGTLSSLATSSVNGNTEFEPWSNKGPLLSNAYNDLGNARPVVVHPPVTVPPLVEGNLKDLDPNTPTTVDKFSVAVSAGPGGTARIGNNNATTGLFDAGTPITVIATPDSGYTFSNWSGTYSSTSATYQFNLAQNTVLAAAFAPSPVTLNINSNIIVPSTTFAANGTPSPSNSSPSNSFDFSYGPGATANFSVLNVPAGYDFTGWTGAVTGAGTSQSTAMTASKTVTANFVPLWTLTVTPNPAGSGTVAHNPQLTTYRDGTNVLLTATPAAGYSFTGYTGLGLSNLTGTTGTVSMTANRDIIANFTLTGGYPLTVQTRCYDFNWNLIETLTDVVTVYPENTMGAFTVPTPTDPAYTFGGWSSYEENPQTGEYVYDYGSEKTSSILMFGPRVVSAYYTRPPTEVTLAVEVYPVGAGTATVGGTETTVTVPYDSGDVPISTTPASADWTLEYWSSYNGFYSEQANDVVPSTSDDTIVAYYVAAPVTLTINVEPPEAQSYAYGAGQHQRNATPYVAVGLNTGWRIQSVTGDVPMPAAVGQTNTGAHYPTMDTDKTITVVAERIKYTLTVSANPADAGSVAADRLDGVYDYNTDAYVSAQANEGWSFRNWSYTPNVPPGNPYYYSTTLTNSAVLMTRDRGVQAMFERARYELVLRASPNTVPVWFTGAGMHNWGSDVAFSAALNTNQNAQNSWKFSRWSADVGNLPEAPFEATSESGTILAMKENRTFTAHYVPATNLRIAKYPNLWGGWGGLPVFTDPVYYELVVTNESWNNAATSVIVTDIVPADGVVDENALYAYHGTASVVDGQIIWEIGTIQPDTSAQLSYQVQYASAGAKTNTATVTTVTLERTLDDNTATATTTIYTGNEADIILTKQPTSTVYDRNGEQFIYEGQDITWQITAQNNAAGNATDTVITDVVPDGWVIKSATSSHGSVTINGQTITVNAGTLQQWYDWVTIDITATAPTPGVYTNTATATTTAEEAIPSNNTASHTIRVRPVAIDLSVRMTNGIITSPLVPASEFQWEAHVDRPSNLPNGDPNNSPATNLVVTTTLPDGINIVSATSNHGTPVVNGKTITMTIPAIRGWEAAYSAIRLRVTADAPGTYTAISTLTCDQDDVNLANNTGQNTVVVNAAAVDVQVTKTGTADNGGNHGNWNAPYIYTTQNMTWTMNVRNNGTSQADNVVLTDTVPAGWNITNVSAVKTAWPYDVVPHTQVGNTVTVPVGTIPRQSGDFVRLVIQATPTQTGSFTNTATVTTSSPETSLTNNTASHSVVVKNPLVDLALEKIGPQEPFPWNLSFAWNVTVSRPAGTLGAGVENNAPVENLVITDTVPEGVTIATATCTTAGAVVVINGQVVTVTIPMWSGTDTVRLTIVCNATRNGSFTNTATVTTTSVEPDTSNNTDSHTVNATIEPGPDMKILKTGDPLLRNKATVGEPYKYTIAVTNLGSLPATNVTITDILPSEMTYVDSNTLSGNTTYDGTTLTWTVPTVLVGDSAYLNVNVVPNQAGTVTNTAVVTLTEPDRDPSNNTSSFTTQILPRDLTVTKSAPASVTVGNTPATFNYTITLTNTGGGTVRNISITDTVPAEAVVTGVSLNGPTNYRGTYSRNQAASFDGNNVSASIDYLYPEESVSVTVSVRVTRNTPETRRIVTITNTAIVTSPDIPPKQGSVTTDLKFLVADVDLTKTSSKDYVTTDGGDPVTFTITARNNGPESAESVVISDTIPEYLTYVSATASNGGTVTTSVVYDPVEDRNIRTVTASWISVLPNLSRTLTINVTADKGPPTDTVVTNTAFVSSTNDFTLDNNSASASIIYKDPILALVKSTTSATVAPGNSIGWSVSVQNLSTLVAAKNIVITDNFGSAGAYINSSGDMIVVSGNSLTNTIANLNPGETKYMSVTTRAPNYEVLLVNTATTRDRSASAWVQVVAGGNNPHIVPLTTTTRSNAAAKSGAYGEFKPGKSPDLDVPVFRSVSRNYEGTGVFMYSHTFSGNIKKEGPIWDWRSTENDSTSSGFQFSREQTGTYTTSGGAENLTVTTTADGMYSHWYQSKHTNHYYGSYYPSLGGEESDSTRNESIRRNYTESLAPDTESGTTRTKEEVLASGPIASARYGWMGAFGAAPIKVTGSMSRDYEYNMSGEAWVWKDEDHWSIARHDSQHANVPIDTFIGFSADYSAWDGGYDNRIGSYDWTWTTTPGETTTWRLGEGENKSPYTAESTTTRYVKEDQDSDSGDYIGFYANGAVVGSHSSNTIRALDIEYVSGWQLLNKYTTPALVSDLMGNMGSWSASRSGGSLETSASTLLNPAGWRADASEESTTYDVWIPKLEAGQKATIQHEETTSVQLHIGDSNGQTKGIETEADTTTVDTAAEWTGPSDGQYRTHTVTNSAPSAATIKGESYTLGAWKGDKFVTRVSTTTKIKVKITP